MNRREFVRTAADAATVAVLSRERAVSAPATSAASKVERIEVVNYRGPRGTGEHLEVAGNDGAVGVFGPLGWRLPNRLRGALPKLRTLLVGKDPLDRKLAFAALWNAVHPGKLSRAYADTPATAYAVLRPTTYGADHWAFDVGCVSRYAMISSRTCPPISVSWRSRPA